MSCDSLPAVVVSSYSQQLLSMLCAGDAFSTQVVQQRSRISRSQWSAFIWSSIICSYIVILNSAFILQYWNNLHSFMTSVPSVYLNIPHLLSVLHIIWNAEMVMILLFHFNFCLLSSLLGSSKSFSSLPVLFYCHLKSCDIFYTQINLMMTTCF